MHGMARAIDGPVGVDIAGPVFGRIAADVEVIRRDNGHVFVVYGDDSRILEVLRLQVEHDQALRVGLACGLPFAGGEQLDASVRDWSAAFAIYGKSEQLPGRAL